MTRPSRVSIAAITLTAVLLGVAPLVLGPRMPSLRAASAAQGKREPAPSFDGGVAWLNFVELAWQLEQRIVLPVVNVHCLYGDVPLRLSVIFCVAFLPAASTGWYEAFAGLNSTPLSSTNSEGVKPVFDGSVVAPEWHLKQSWYS